MPDDNTSQPSQAPQTVQPPAEAPNPLIAQILNVQPDLSTMGTAKKSLDGEQNTMVQPTVPDISIKKHSA